jgi:microcystin-dependent protein
MSDQFLGEIRPVGFNFAPVGWALCNGQLLSISQNSALFSLLGTNFGGDGRTTFGLPNLQGMAALGMGQGPGLTDYPIGGTAGVATVTLNLGQLGPHVHTPVAEGGRIAATGNTPVGNAWGKSGQDDTPYSNATPNVTMSPASTTPAGGNGAHNNMMPYQVINFVIALVGIFPPRG